MVEAEVAVSKEPEELLEIELVVYVLLMLAQELGPEIELEVEVYVDVKPDAVEVVMASRSSVVEPLSFSIFS